MPASRRSTRQPRPEKPATSWPRFRSPGEVVGHVAVNVLTNYFNVLTQVDNDWPVVTPINTRG